MLIEYARQLCMVFITFAPFFWFFRWVQRDAERVHNERMRRHGRSAD